MSDLAPASPSPKPSSQRFLTGAFVVSLVAHIIFFAVGSRFPTAAPARPGQLMGVAFIPAAPKKITLAAVPHPPRHQAPVKPRRVVPPRVMRVARHIMQPAAKPMTLRKLRMAQAPAPNKPVPPPLATRPQTPAHDHPPRSNAGQSRSAPPVPGLHSKTPRRFANRLPDEETYPTHPFEGDTTRSPALPPTNTNSSRHQDLDLATGSDAATGPAHNSSRATHLRHSGLTGGNHSDTQPFLPDGNQGSGVATDNGAPSRANDAAPGGTENGSARERDSSGSSADAGSSDDSGFNHSGLPRSQNEGGNGPRPASSRQHGNDDAAGATGDDDSQPSGRSGQRGGSRHHQRFADNPFGNALLEDKPLPQIKPTPTQRLLKSMPVEVVKARRLDNSKPEYPAEAKRLNEQGTVRLRVVIGAEGTVESVQLEQSSGYDDLDEAAQHWARDLKFEPARSGGKAVESTWHMLTPFNLRRLN